jgi:hypothetical protein
VISTDTKFFPSASVDFSVSAENRILLEGTFKLLVIFLIF